MQPLGNNPKLDQMRILEDGSTKALKEEHEGAMKQGFFGKPTNPHALPYRILGFLGILGYS